MNELELREKIDIAINSIKKNNKTLYSKMDSITLDNSLENREYQLNKYNYFSLKNRHKIKKGELFINRCNNYINYLDAINSKSEINIKMKEYEFIRNLQSELFFLITSEIEVLEQMKKLDATNNKKIELENKIEKLKNNIDKYRKVFSNESFCFLQDKIYTTEYLDYEVLNVVDRLYKKEDNKIKKTA